MLKKLQLEVIDPTGQVVVTHHFNYNVGEHYTLRLTVDKTGYLLDSEGVMTHFVKPNCEPVKKQLVGDILYTNRETGKTQKLFDILTPVFTVRYMNGFVGNKGEASYITLQANDVEEAKRLAMENKKFTKHICMTYYDEKYLSAYPAKGNYVIGKIEYYEGDPRL